MPDLCKTHFTIHVGDYEKAKLIFSEIDRVTFCKKPLSDEAKISSPIEIVGANSDGSITVITTTEIVPPVDVIRALVNKYCPEAKVDYVARASNINCDSYRNS